MLKFKNLKRAISSIIACTMLVSVISTSTIKAAEYDWESSARNVSSNLLSLGGSALGGPAGGLLTGVILDLIWPTGNEDMFEQLKEKFQNQIDESIIDLRTTEYGNLLDYVHGQYTYYKDATTQEGKEYFFTGMENALVPLRANITGNQYADTRKKMLPVITSVAALDLVLLSEQVINCESIYGTAGDKGLYYNELLDTYSQYSSTLYNTYNEWKTWRLNSIKYNFEDTTYPAGSRSRHLYKVTVKDEVTGEYLYNKECWDSGYGILQQEGQEAKRKADEKVVADMDSTKDIINNLYKTLPVGCVNLALNKTATANNEFSYEPASKAVDGTTENNSKWCGTKGNNSPTWLKVDLGRNYGISRWVVKHAGSGDDYSIYNTSNFKLQRSFDGQSWMDVDSVTNNTDNITDRTVPTFNARYVRLYITVPTLNFQDPFARIYEFEVY